jgi:quinol-cytochrome oxidoreductase complex cytochrome b subunit
MDESPGVAHKPKDQKQQGGGRPRNFIYHLHPPRVAKASIRFDRTFGLGGMALLLFLVLAFSGLLLRFAYIPTPAEAYDSILMINSEILFGKFVRNIHYWSGIFMVIITFLHFVRTFLAQAYYDIRRINWILGLALLILVVFSNFTGYLLPWDQLSFWAVTVATNMLDYFPGVGKAMQDIVRGGADVSSATLLNFFTFHTGILPVLMTMVMVYHFWKVRKAKGVALPADAKETERVPSNPDLLVRELTVGLTLIAVILLLSVFFAAPLQDRANPAYSPNPAKAPWYFMGIQELLLHMHPFFSVIVLPFLFFAAMVYLPYHRWSGHQPGRWFHSEKGMKLAVQAVMLAAIITPLVVLIDEYVFRIKDWAIGTPLFISQGLIPFTFLILTLVAYVIYLKKIHKAGSIEITIALFVVFVTAYIILTIVGVWFRGEGMALVWPWNI